MLKGESTYNGTLDTIPNTFIGNVLMSDNTQGSELQMVFLNEMHF